MSTPIDDATKPVPPNGGTTRTPCVHVVSHTHWDREWYRSASRFRQQLVSLIDALLSGTTGASSTFLLDGQAVLLADYLAVRPEREAALRERLQAGALEAGPWYVLADNLIPSGEALLRNLAAGTRVLARLGARAPRVAYCPDTFGHPAMLPAIAAGHGLPLAIVWRGLGGTQHPAVDTLRWRAPDGSLVLVHHLPPDGYEWGSALPVDAPGVAARWQRLADGYRLRSNTAHALLPNGADHHARQPDRDVATQLLAAAAGDDGIALVDSSLCRFSEALVAATVDVPLPVVDGELRDSYGYTWTLQGTLGTRAAQKRRNAMLERTLLRDVEPWLALAWLHGGAEAFAVAPDGRLTLAQLPALLDACWDSLLRTHPHDTLCGCSTDEVALAMDDRQRAVRDEAAGLRQAALQLALGHDVVQARRSAVLDVPPVVVRNRSGRVRSGVTELRCIETIGDVRVGPGSAGGVIPRASGRAAPPALSALTVQYGASRLAHARRESPQHYPDDDLVRVHRALAWVPAVPAHGVRVFGGEATTSDDANAIADALASESEPPPATLTETVEGIVLDNGLVQLRCAHDGVTLRMGDRVLSRAITLESTTDAGDSYTASLRGHPRWLRITHVRAGARGPLRVSVRVRWSLPRAVPTPDRSVPADLAAALPSPRHTPSSVETHRPRAGRVEVETELVLDAGSTLLRCEVRGLNRRRDHRLRLCVHTDTARATCRADAAFGPVERTPVQADARARAIEMPPATMPLHRWMTSVDARRGVALLADGLAEGEIVDGTMAVTLLRAIGELSRGNLPERPGHAGWPCATPRAQSQGRFRARVALLLHDAWSASTLEQIEHACDDFLLPLSGETWRDYTGTARIVAGPQLEGAGLRASAVTLSQDGESLLLRVTNVSEEAVDGCWRLPTAGPWRVQRCRLDELPLDDPVTCAAELRFSAAPRELVTLRVRRETTAHHR